MLHLDPNMTYYIIYAIMLLITIVYFVLFFILLNAIDYEKIKSPRNEKYEWQKRSFEERLLAFEPWYCWIYSGLGGAIFTTWLFGFGLYQNYYGHRWISMIILIINGIIVLSSLKIYYISWIFLIAKCKGIWSEQLKQLLKYENDHRFWIKRIINRPSFYHLYSSKTKIMYQVKEIMNYFKNNKTGCYFISLSEEDNKILNFRLEITFWKNGVKHDVNIKKRINLDQFNDDNLLFWKDLLLILEYNKKHPKWQDKSSLWINELNIDQDEVELIFSDKYFPKITYLINDKNQILIAKLFKKLDLIRSWWKDCHQGGGNYLVYNTNDDLVAINNEQTSYNECLISNNYKSIRWRYKEDQNHKWNSFKFKNCSNCGKMLIKSFANGGY